MAKRLTKFNNAVVNEVVPDFVYYDGVRYDKAYYDGYVMFGLVDEETEEYDQESLTTEPPTQAETTVPPLVQDVCIAVIFNEIGPYGEGNGTPIYRYLPPSIQGQDYMLQLNVDEDSPFEVESVADVNIYRTNSVWVGDEFEFYDDGKLFIKIPKINDTYYFVYVNVTNDSSYNPPTHAPIIETHLDEGKDYTVDLHFKFMASVPNSEEAETEWRLIGEDDLTMRAFGLAAYDSDLLGQWNNVGKGYMYHTMPIMYDSQGHYDGYASMVTFTVYDEIGECDMTNYVRVAESNGSFTVELMDFYPDQNDRGRMTVTVYTDYEVDAESGGQYVEPTEAPTTPRPWARSVEFFVEIYDETGERYATFESAPEFAYSATDIVCDIPVSLFGEFKNIDAVHVYDDYNMEIPAQIKYYDSAWRVYSFGNELDYYHIIVDVVKYTGYNAVIVMTLWDSNGSSQGLPSPYHNIRIDKAIDIREANTITEFDLMRSEFEGYFDDVNRPRTTTVYGIDHIETITGSGYNNVYNATFRDFTFKYTLMEDRIRFYDIEYPQLMPNEIDRQGYAFNCFMVTDKYAYEDPEPTYKVQVRMYDQNYMDVVKQQTIWTEGSTPVNEFTIPRRLYGDVIRIMNAYVFAGRSDGSGSSNIVNDYKVELTNDGIRFYDMDNPPSWDYFNVRVQVEIKKNSVPDPVSSPEVNDESIRTFDMTKPLSFTNTSGSGKAYVGFWNFGSNLYTEYNYDTANGFGTSNLPLEFSFDGETWYTYRNIARSDYPQPSEYFYRRNYKTGGFYDEEIIYQGWDANIAVTNPIRQSQYTDTVVYMASTPHDWLILVGPGETLYVRGCALEGSQAATFGYEVFEDYFYTFGSTLKVNGNIMSMPYGASFLNETYDPQWWYLLSKGSWRNIDLDDIEYVQGGTTTPEPTPYTTPMPTVGEAKIRDGSNKDFLALSGNGRITVNYPFEELWYSYDRMHWYRLHEDDTIELQYYRKLYLWRESDLTVQTVGKTDKITIDKPLRIMAEQFVNRSLRGQATEVMRGWFTPDDTSGLFLVFASGDVRSLLTWSFETITEIPDYAFTCCFRGLPLYNMPSMPHIDKVWVGGCAMMYAGCRSLAETSPLTAVNVHREGYYGMFMDCIRLTQMPELPAMTIGSSAYREMFSGCTSLDKAVKSLPAKRSYRNDSDQGPIYRAGLSCYYGMFKNCTSLVKAPEIDADALEAYTCKQMFMGCTSLTQAPVLKSTELKYNTYESMFEGCTSLVTMPDLPATRICEEVYMRMFYGCTSLTAAKYLPAPEGSGWDGTSASDRCYKSMFEGCTSLSSVAGINLRYIGKYSCERMFKGCTSLTVSPDLYSRLVNEGCYYQMFMSSGITQRGNVSWVFGIGSYRWGEMMFFNTAVDTEWREHVTSIWNPYGDKLQDFPWKTNW